MNKQVQRKAPSAATRTAQTGALNVTDERAPYKTSISQRQSAVKRQNALQCVVALIAAAIVATASATLTNRGADSGQTVAAETPIKTVDTVSCSEPERDQQAAYYFAVSETGCPVDVKEMTTAWAREAGFEKRYVVTDEERYELAQVVTAEADGEPFAGKVAVAQCILQAAEDDGIRPPKVFAKYGYTRARPEPTQESIEAVSAVFDFGYTATKEPIKYFYNPDIVASAFHESQIYVMTINNHRFFKEAKR